MMSGKKQNGGIDQFYRRGDAGDFEMGKVLGVCTRQVNANASLVQMWI